MRKQYKAKQCMMVAYATPNSKVFRMLEVERLASKTSDSDMLIRLGELHAMPGNHVFVPIEFEIRPWFRKYVPIFFNFLAFSTIFYHFINICIFRWAAAGVEGVKKKGGNGYLWKNAVTSHSLNTFEANLGQLGSEDWDSVRGILDNTGNDYITYVLRSESD